MTSEWTRTAVRPPRSTLARVGLLLASASALSVAVLVESAAALLAYDPSASGRSGALRGRLAAALDESGRR